MIRRLHSGVILGVCGECYGSCVLVVVPGEDQFVCKSAIAQYLNVIKRDWNQGANKSNHPN
jgi:hypothetical protein